MSTKPDDLELDIIHGIAQRSPKVQELIAEKNKTLFDMDRTQTTTSKKPSPAPKPKGDIRIVKSERKETISKEDNEKRKMEVSREYDEQIKDEMLDSAKSLGDYEDYTIGQLENMPSKDASVLAEKGVDGYKHLQEQKGIETREKQFEENKESLDISMTDKELEELFGEPEKDQEITTLEDKEIVHNHDIELNLEMDEGASDKLFEDRDFNLDEFKENQKDLDVNKRPSPSDDFE